MIKDGKRKPIGIIFEFTGKEKEGEERKETPRVEQWIGKRLGLSSNFPGKVLDLIGQVSYFWAKSSDFLEFSEVSFPICFLNTNFK